MHEIIPIGKFPKKKDFGRPVSDAAGYQGIEADFKERYMDVLQSAPELPAARIKYFCSVLLHLCAEEGFETESLAFDDFFAFMLKLIRQFQTGAAATGKQKKQSVKWKMNIRFYRLK